MKKKSLLFLLYCASIIIIVLLLLIFRPFFTKDPSSSDVQVEQSQETGKDSSSTNSSKDETEEDKNVEDNFNDNKDENSSNTDKDNNLNDKDDNLGIEDDKSEEGNKETNESEGDDSTSGEDVIYAESLKLNSAKDITILVGEQVKLENGYLTVVPSGLIADVAYAITPRYSSPADGISFKNNIIEGIKIGSYKISFKVKKSETTYLSEDLVVRVVETRTNSLATQLITEMTVGDSIAIEDMFDISFVSSYSILTNEILSYNLKIVAMQAGMGKIILELTKDMVTYVYKFSLIVNAVPNYEIEVENLIGSELILESNINKLHYLTFLVKNGEVEDIDQDVEITVSDKSIISVVNVEPPMIFIRCLSFGSVDITITYQFDTTITKTFTIIFLEKKPT